MTLNDFSPARIEAWLDDHGRGAWIAAIVLGFIAFWPLGLALLLWMLWRGKAGSKSGSCGRRSRKTRAFEEHLRAQAAERDRETFEAFMARRNAQAGAPAREAQ